MIPIFIPTWGRVGKQVAWDQLPPALRAQTLLVVHPDELAAHVKLGRSVLGCPVQGRGPAVVREWLVDYAHRNKLRKIVTIDDDVKLQVRNDADMKIVDALPSQIMECVAWMGDQLEEVATCGISARSLNFDKRGEYVEGGRQVAVHGINVADFRRLSISHVKNAPAHLPSPYMEDFYVVLQLLMKGHPNRVSLRYRYTNGVSNAPGGCSLTRKFEEHNASAEFLAATFPGIVKLRTKQNLWRGMSMPTKDVTIYWQRALEMGRRLK